MVVDVRDDDYIGGNIANSVNHPSYTFEDNVHKLVEKTKNVPMVIFHCALSQQRYATCLQGYDARAPNDYSEGQKLLECVPSGLSMHLVNLNSTNLRFMLKRARLPRRKARSVNTKFSSFEEALLSCRPSSK